METKNKISSSLINQRVLCDIAVVLFEGNNNKTTRPTAVHPRHYNILTKLINESIMYIYNLLRVAIEDHNYFPNYLNIE